MDNSFKSIVTGAKSIIILLPTKPYFDQAAAALSLYLALRDQKEVTVYSPSPMTVEFNRLIGINKVSGELGNKNLVIRFTEYKASDIERVSYDIENSQFRLTVIPKQKIAPPTKDQIEIAYSGITADTVIIVGGANESHFPSLTSKDLTGTNLVHVGTRDISMSSNKNYVSFSRPASSISEIVAELIKEGGFNLDEDIATNLLMGIEETTNRFQDSSISADTFMVIADLMKAGGKRLSSQNIAQRKDFPTGSIPNSYPRPLSVQPAQPFQGGQPQVVAPVQPQAPIQNPTLNTPKPFTKSEEKTPDDWLQPKIYKGSSVS